MGSPPETPRREVIEEYHGEEVVDPYRWLEEGSDEVAGWVDAQNDYADAYLHTDTREALRPRYEPLAEVAEYYPVDVAGGRYFQRVEAPGQDQPVLTVREQPDGDRRTLVDPNGWPTAHSLDWYAPSHDGEYVAYGRQEGGDEQYDLRVVETATGETVLGVDGVGRTNRFMLAWTPDSTALYYVATGGAGEQFEKEVRRQPLEGDAEVLLEHRDPHVWPVVGTDRETGTLLLGLSEMVGGTEIYVYDGTTGEFVPAITDTDAEFTPALHDGVAYFRTDLDAPRGRVLSCPLDRLAEGGVDPAEFEEVLPEREGTLEAIDVGRDRLIAHHQRDAYSRLRVYDLDGAERHELPLPAYSTVEGVTANPDAREAFYRIEGFDRPPTIQRGDLDDATTTTLDAPDLTPEREVDLTVSQEWFESTDGAEVPVFVVRRADLDRDGDNPAMLYGYGGFRNSLTPTFDRFRLPFLADGGVYAQVCARGGREFGEAWHEAGMLDEKQHTFDDFIGAAEHLVERGYTRPDRLAVAGGSNGGLSVGAVITQRPDLFSAAFCAVPLLDMLRFHEFLLGESWTTEYGTPEDPDAYEYIKAYSPYHNVEPGRAYPAVLFKTAAGDTRVHPSHARKMTARMQAEAEGGPFLLRTQTDTGHGVGKPTSMVLEEQLDRWTFLYDRLGIDVEPSG